MIVRFLNFVIFLNLLAIAKEFHVYVTLILQSTETLNYESSAYVLRFTFLWGLTHPHEPEWQTAVS